MWVGTPLPAAAAACGVAACPVSMSSSSTVMPFSPLGPSAARPDPRPFIFDCELAALIASDQGSSYAEYILFRKKKNQKKTRAVSSHTAHACTFA